MLRNFFRANKHVHAQTKNQLFPQIDRTSLKPFTQPRKVSFRTLLDTSQPKHELGFEYPSFSPQALAAPKILPQDINPTKNLIFTGPSGAPVRMLKRMSFITASLGAFSLPLFWLLWDHPWVVQSELNYSTVVFACLASFGSTGFMHWFCSPYVIRLYHHPDLKPSVIDLLETRGDTSSQPETTMGPGTVITLETTGITGSPKFTTVRLGDLIPGRKANVTWRIKSELHRWARNMRRDMLADDEENRIHYAQSRFWIDMPNSPGYPGQAMIYSMDEFLKNWAPLEPKKTRK